MNTREQFVATSTALLDERPDVAVVLAEISLRFFGEALEAHPERVINVGIREQLLIGTGAGLALTGMRPIVHTYASFLVERPFEQIKLSFAHQGVGGVLVSCGASFDEPASGRTHQAPGDVALMLTLPETTVHAPATNDEVDAAIREAVAGDGLHYVRVSALTNSTGHAPGVHEIRRGTGPTVIAFGPTLDDVLAATEGIDATVLYTQRVSPADVATLAQLVDSTDVVLVEPWLEGTTTHLVTAALDDRPRRMLSLGVGHQEVRRYGTAEEHKRLHGLDADSLRERITRFAH